MAIVWLLIFLVVFLLVMGCMWVAHKLTMSIKRDERKFEQEEKK